MKEGIKFGLGCMVGAGIGALIMGVCIDVYESVARYDEPK